MTLNRLIIIILSLRGWPLFDPSAVLLLWTTFGTILIRTLFCCYISYICALSSMTLFIGPTCSKLYVFIYDRYLYDVFWYNLILETLVSAQDCSFIPISVVYVYLLIPARYLYEYTLMCI